MSDHPHGLTPGWSAEELCADLATLRREVLRDKTRGWWWYVFHPGTAKRLLQGMHVYAFEAVSKLDARQPAELASPVGG